MGDFVMHCVKVIEGIWRGCEPLVPVLIVSVCVMELGNQVYGLRNAVNSLEEELSDHVRELKNAVGVLEDLKGDDSDDEGYTTEEIREMFRKSRREN